MGVILYFIPAGKEKKTFLMDWETSKKLPWDIVLLFGGGFALAIGFKDSGLSAWFGQSLGFVKDSHPIIIIFVVAFITMMLTELTSNTATTQILLPILASFSVSLTINPIFIMIPATLAASMAYMLPVATPPNAIVFSSGKISVIEMVKTGFVLNILSAILITLFTYFLAPIVFHASLTVFPGWVN